jgi:hypothetical protein
MVWDLNKAPPTKDGWTAKFGKEEPNTSLNLNISRNKFFWGNKPLEKKITVNN